MTAEDVAATFNLHADPDNGSNALSAFNGVLSKGGAQGGRRRRRSSSSSTRRTATSPTYVSSDNYNLIILPKDFDRRSGRRRSPARARGSWRSTRRTWASTTRATRTTGTRGASRSPTATRSSTTTKEQARVLGAPGRRGRRARAVLVVRRQGAADRPEHHTHRAARRRSHRQMHMRTDKEPFNDKRVRQAIALLVDRDDLVKGLLDGKSDYGNDSPFAPVYPSTDKRAAAPAATWRRPRRCCGGGQGRRLQRRARPLERLRDAPSTRSWSRTTSARPGIEIKLNITDARHLLRRRGVRQVAVAGLDDRDHRVRPPRRAERVPRRAAQEQRHVELGALQEQGRTTSSSTSTSRRSTSTSQRGDGQARSRSCCSTRCRSSSPTSTTTSRRTKPTWPACDGPPWATSTSARRARRPERRRARARSPPSPASSPSASLLGLITLLLLSIVDLPGRAGAAGRRGRARPRPVRRPAVGRRAQPAAGHGPPADRAVLGLDPGVVHRRPRRRRSTAARCRTSDRTALVDSAKLALLAFIIVVPLAILGGVFAAMNEGSARDRLISRRRAVGHRHPRVRLGGDLHRRLRARAAGSSRPRRQFPDGRERLRAGEVPVPAGAVPRLRAVRLHRAHGPRGDDRGARRRLHAHGDPEGAATAHRHPPPRAAQLAAADDRGGRHAGRLPDRRPRDHRAHLQLPGDRPGPVPGRHAEGHPGAPERRAARRASSTWSPR